MFSTNYGFLIDESAMLTVITLDVEGHFAHPPATGWLAAYAQIE